LVQRRKLFMGAAVSIPVGLAPWVIRVTHFSRRNISATMESPAQIEHKKQGDQSGKEEARHGNVGFGRGGGDVVDVDGGY
jgi:hypothetical protein